jgi:hypothetical protein
MKTLSKTLVEKHQIDAEIAEMNKFPIDFSDIPPLKDEDRSKVRFGNERLLEMLPDDILKEMAKRRLQQTGYKIPISVIGVS